MRLVAVSVVKNDADIIEPFVRHTGKWVDHHLIFDHDSTDGTREILLSLQQEGIPLTLFTDDAVGNLQQLRSNHLTRLAAKQWNADWVLVLDADEILIGPSRAELTRFLGDKIGDQPVSVPLLNYYRTTDDDSSISNPLDRLQYCQALPSSTRKLFIPNLLASNPGAVAGMGSHVMHLNGQAIADQPLPGEYWLAHLSLRTGGQQVMRVIVSELQKIAGGSSQAGLALHYRLGFQLLSENPELFLSITCPDSSGLRSLPIDYRGGDLRYAPPGTEWTRLGRALLPYFEKLAVSHGKLVDQTASDEGSRSIESPIYEITSSKIPPPLPIGSVSAFSGFVSRQGWGEKEGPVPEAFLPQFHWGYAPSTVLSISSVESRTARFVAEALTYSEQQTLILELNGVPLLQHTFQRVNQKDILAVTLPLSAGDNLLTIHYTKCLQSERDPRKLAVIFLALRILT